MTQRALEFIDRCDEAKHPFYLQVSHYAVHLDIYYHAATLKRIKRDSEPGEKHNMPEFAAMTADMLSHLSNRD